MVVAGGAVDWDWWCIWLGLVVWLVGVDGVDGWGWWCRWLWLVVWLIGDWWCGWLGLVEHEISEGDLVNYIFLIV